MVSQKKYIKSNDLEFNRLRLKYVNQCPIEVYYETKVVGDYVADFVVEDKIIVEVKAIKQLSREDENQLLNYLTATNKEVGLLLNYGVKPEVKRKVYDNELKKYKSEKIRVAP